MSASSSDSAAAACPRSNRSGHLRSTTSLTRSYRDLLGNIRTYSWSDWREDNEEAIWQLFYGITSTVRDNDLPFLDRLEFPDFVSFCQRHTSRPARSKADQAAVEADDEDRSQAGSDIPD